MFIKPGVTYKLTFISGFEELTGLYTVLKVLSNDEMVSDGLSILETYTTVGKTESEFLAAKPEYAERTFLKIQSIADETVIYYISELMLEYVPDFSAKPYYNLGLTVHLGAFKSEDDLIGITTDVKNMLAITYGCNEDPVLFTHGNPEWLVDSEYDIIETNRDLLKEVVVNDKVLINRLSAENTVLRQRVADLEKFLLPPMIIDATIDNINSYLAVTFNKTVSRTDGTFILHGSVSGDITTSYASGNNTNQLVYTPDVPVHGGETFTLTYTGPGVTGPLIVQNLLDITSVFVLNRSTNP